MDTPAVSSSKTKILIVDDHPIVRRGFLELINQEPDLEVGGEAETVNDAYSLISQVKPDLIILDISLKEGNGLDLLKRIASDFPSLPVLVVSMHDESLYAERVIRLGARGYVMKEEAEATVISAIRHVLRGQIYLSGPAQERLVRTFSNRNPDTSESLIHGLSNRELEIFRLIGEGQGTRQIAERLGISQKTVESFRARIKQKLRLTSGLELVQQAILWTQNR
ncbi:MAG TPA: response regulator transcription factor [bacterium]|nr:response regulator transcription factor [Candidatus Omnitrophota bacterium]HOJ62215.1 response regulator transcription factor [bacterium]HOL95211.1 response regulator transcription factor [bacterium]HPP00966.1 response regulator transcription factor [bacterium]HXK95686.1 response regulator transcription factor [bacterium]